MARLCKGALRVGRHFRLTVPEYDPVPRFHLPTLLLSRADIGPAHLSEAVGCRSLDRKLWAR